MKLYGAIDLHSNNNVTVLIDEQDKVVYAKRLPNDLRVSLNSSQPTNRHLKVLSSSRPTTGTGWSTA